MSDRLTTAELNALRVRRWRAADARRVLELWQASGMSVSAFGRQHGLAAQRLCWWRKQLVDWDDVDAREDGAAMRLVPAVVVGGDVGAAPVAIRLPAGIVLEVANTAAVAPTWLAAVVAALSRPV